MESDPILIKRGKLSVQVKTMLGLGLVEICYFAAISCLAPFFTKEAEKKGVSVSVSGIVFIVSPLVLVITSPFLGTAVKWFGARKFFFMGMLLLGFSNICFGFLDQIESSGTFAFLCILCRGIAGIGSVAMCSNVIFLTEAFPDEINKAVGLNEIFAGVGVSLGPTIGGILYDWGGFPLPFWIIGAAVLCLIPVGAYLLPQVESDSEKMETDSTSAHWWEIIKSPVIFLNLWLTFIFACGWTFLDPILEPHLREEFGVSSSTIGGIFFVMAVAYTVSSVLIGAVSDNIKQAWILSFIGCCGSGVAILFLDPSLFVQDFTQLWSKSVGLGFLGMFVGVGLIPTYGAMVKDTIERGLPDDSFKYGTLSGFWNSCYAIGDVVGPSLGAVVTQHFGFNATCTMVSASFFVTAVLYFIQFTTPTRSRSGYTTIGTNLGSGNSDVESSCESWKHTLSGSCDMTGFVPPLIHSNERKWRHV